MLSLDVACWLSECSFIKLKWEVDLRWTDSKKKFRPAPGLFDFFQNNEEEMTNVHTYKQRVRTQTVSTIKICSRKFISVFCVRSEFLSKNQSTTDKSILPRNSVTNYHGHGIQSPKPQCSLRRRESADAFSGCFWCSFGILDYFCLAKIPSDLLHFS